jgi:peptide/histidine transporter 3/4
MGWIADAKIGRYKSLYYSTICIFISSILMIVGYLMHVFSSDKSPEHLINLISTILLGLSIVFNVIGFACMDANIIPFLTDQVQGASGEKLSALIHWHFFISALSEFVNITMYDLLIGLRNREAAQYITISMLALHCVISGGVLVCCRLVTKWLDVTPQITNPIKLIVKVFKNVCVNKANKNNRSALTYWEDTTPSRLDKCKQKYGGLFTEEEVEDVKTALRLLPLVFLSVSFGFTLNPLSYSDAYLKPSDRFGYVMSNYITNSGIHNSLYTMVLIVVFHLFIYPCFYNYIPSLLKRIGFGILLSTLSLTYQAVLDPIAQVITNSTNATVYTDDQVCLLSNLSMSNDEIYSLEYYWTIPAVAIGGLGEFFIVPFVLEFIVAQTPGSMKGMMVGFWFAFYGLAHLLSFCLYFPFSKIPGPSIPSCLFYYFFMKVFISATIFVLFVYFARWYKMRTRDVPINFHLLAENHYNKYLGTSIAVPINKDISYSRDSYDSSCSSCD